MRRTPIQPDHAEARYSERPAFDPVFRAAGFDPDGVSGLSAQRVGGEDTRREQSVA
jgi:hypothetical protein